MKARLEHHSDESLIRDMYVMLVVGETRLLRFFFGLTGLFYAAFVLWGAPHDAEYQLAFAALPRIWWSLLLGVSAAAIIWGAFTKKYGYVSLFLEGVVGSLTWMAFSIFVMVAQGSVGVVTIFSLINLYLFMRYPTFQGEHV